MPSASERQISIRVGGAGGELVLQQFEVSERLSEPFVISAQVISPEAEVDFLPRLGDGVGIDVAGDGELNRRFHGILTDAAYTHESDEGYHYALTIRPRLWLLGHNSNMRIFQKMSTLDIVQKVFAGANFSDYALNLQDRPATARKYCVQFRESDLAFVTRLIEDEGIYYYFAHDENKEVLHLANSKNSHGEAPEFGEIPFYPPAGESRREISHIWSWSEQVSTNAVQKVTLRDYDFKEVDRDFVFKQQAAEAHALDGLERYDYPTCYDVKTASVALAAHKLEAARAERRIFRGEGEMAGLGVGNLFKMTQHANARFNQEYLVVGMNYSASAESYRSGGATGTTPLLVHIEAIPSSTSWRGPGRFTKPVARGPQSAVVTGPPNEVVHVDKYGRVKVHFFWDRAQPLADADDNSSCWLRVSDSWADGGFGTVMLPRVGQEVIVDFLDGDPDRPIVTGRVYNGAKTQTYGLPANKTRSLWRTQTVGKTGQNYSDTEEPPTGVGFNELRFEDKEDAEEVFIHAQRDMKAWVRRDDDLKIGRDLTTRVGHDRTTNIKRHEITTVEDGDETHTVKAGKRVTTVHADDSLKVEQGNLTTTVAQGNMDTKVSMGDKSVDVKMGNFSLKTDMGAVTIEAMQSITLKVGASKVVVDQMGVSVEGMTVKLHGTMQLQAQGMMTQVNGDVMLQAQGAIVMIN